MHRGIVTLFFPIVDSFSIIQKLKKLGHFCNKFDVIVGRGLTKTYVSRGKVELVMEDSEWTYLEKKNY